MIDSSGAGILALGAGGEVRSANSIARRMFWIQADNHLKFESDTAENRFHEILCQILQTGQRESLRETYFLKRRQQQVLAVVLSPLRNSKGRTVGVVIVATDITENQLLSFEVEQLRQYGLLGEISLGLAHDIKNPLASIQGCARLLSKSGVSAENRAELTNIIQHDVVMQMLAYGNISKVEQSAPMDVNAVLHSCGNIIERQKFNKQIKINYHLEDKLPILKAREIHIQQMFLNLILNSMQAINRNGEIFIDSWYEAERHALYVRIRDTGMGMSAAIRDSAFDPYFTTKQAGSGMGLFVVKRTLEMYGGEIQLESEPGCGTTCTVMLSV